MRFMHRNRNMKYVYNSKDTYWEDAGKYSRRLPKRQYRVEFSNNAWDSLHAQQVNGWTDEERAEIEQYLLHHKDFAETGGGSLVHGVGGLYLEAEDKPLAETGAIAAQAQERCIWSRVLENGSAEQCGRFRRKGAQFCALHERELEEVNS
jgi:hypothetical protein